MKVTFDGSYGIPSSVSHPAAARHSFVTGLNSDPPLQVKVTYDGFYLQSVKGKGVSLSEVSGKGVSLSEVTRSSVVRCYQATEYTAPIESPTEGAANTL
ncbi:hypothetical protein OsJ_14807 [Oryza sativa Japonica Group]|uniref:Uncharacterized protein n=2 Tax=Oryza sativa subsp. japonica TaxID=39947 RepID=A0A8J8Y5X9_ORYSJ|nr:hypothetical protein OsJ_14807 [Oryza sativa Japonica Group]CAE05425.2 OSJNBa0035I04.13 [Oryza sativa Japonica Group]